MPFTLCLPPEEQALLDRVSRQSARNPDDLVRQGIRELCQGGPARLNAP